MSKNQKSHSKFVGRNEPCPCGSGKKFKKCCLTMFSGQPGESDSGFEFQTNQFLPDFVTCPDLKGISGFQFEAKFLIGNGLGQQSDGLLILGSTSQEYKGKNYQDKYFATIDVEKNLAPPIRRVVELLQEHARGIGPADDLPLVICGTFQIEALVQSTFESYRPIKAVSIDSLIIAYLTIPFSELKDREGEIIERLKRYIMVRV